MLRKLTISGLVAALGLLAVPTLADDHDHDHHHHGDLQVGHSATGQLNIEFDFDEPQFLPPVSGLLNGWAGDDPGFMARHEDEADEDYYQLEPGAQIRFELVGVDPALKAYAPGFGTTLSNPGDSFVFPVDDEDILHTHLTWHIDATDPAFDPLQTVWSLDFRLADVGTTGYAASEVYTLQFTNVPEPASLGVLLAAVLLLARRRA